MCLAGGHPPTAREQLYIVFLEVARARQLGEPLVAQTHQRINVVLKLHLFCSEDVVP